MKNLLMIINDLKELVEMMEIDRELTGRYGLTKETKEYSKSLQSEIEEMRKEYIKEVRRIENLKTEYTEDSLDGYTIIEIEKAWLGITEEVATKSGWAECGIEIKEEEKPLFTVGEWEMINGRLQKVENSYYGESQIKGGK